MVHMKRHCAGVLMKLLHNRKKGLNVEMAVRGRHQKSLDGTSEDVYGLLIFFNEA